MSSIDYTKTTCTPKYLFWKIVKKALTYMHVLKPYRFIWVYELKGHETPFINNNHEKKEKIYDLFENGSNKKRT